MFNNSFIVINNDLLYVFFPRQFKTFFTHSKNALELMDSMQSMDFVLWFYAIWWMLAPKHTHTSCALHWEACLHVSEHWRNLFLRSGAKRLFSSSFSHHFDIIRSKWSVSSMWANSPIRFTPAIAIPFDVLTITHTHTMPLISIRVFDTFEHILSNSRKFTFRMLIYLLNSIIIIIFFLLSFHCRADHR